MDTPAICLIGTMSGAPTRNMVKHYPLRYNIRVEPNKPTMVEIHGSRENVQKFVEDFFGLTDWEFSITESDAIEPIGGTI